MSVYKRKGSPYYHYDFQRQGVRFWGSTETASRKEAEKVEKRKIKEAVADLEAGRHRSQSKQITISAAAARFFEEKGQHDSSSDATFSRLGNIVRILGEATLLADVTTETLIQMVAIRRGEPTRHGGLPANATVNRDIQVYRRMRSYAEKAWKMDVGICPDFSEVLLEEPDERFRELHFDEEERLFNELREDYCPLIEFMLITGLRLSNAVLLRKRQVNWTDGVLTFKQKSRKLGGKNFILPMTRRCAELIRSQWLHHNEFVWTYEAQRTSHGRKAGERHPMTVEGFKSTIDRCFKNAGLEDFRVHDLRHTFGSRLTRRNRNLAVTQRALGHATINSTARYAHVLLDDVRSAMEDAEDHYNGDNSRQYPRQSKSDVE